MTNSCRHSERSEAKRNAVEESREPDFKPAPRDPSTPLEVTPMSL